VLASTAFSASAETADVAKRCESKPSPQRARQPSRRQRKGRGPGRTGLS
jgi:hypothetical protein